MHETQFQVTYQTIENGETYDVSFELSEDAEERLFTGLAEVVHENTSNGTFDGQLMHLYKKLADQQQSYPPWVDVDGGKRVYDLELTESDYSTLARIVGSQLGNVLRPDAADTYLELVDALESITDQMLIEDEIDEFHNETLSTYYNQDIPDDPENGTFQCFLYDGTVAMYENERTGDTWYRCTECETMYSELTEDHACL